MEIYNMCVLDNYVHYVHYVYVKHSYVQKYNKYIYIYMSLIIKSNTKSVKIYFEYKTQNFSIFLSTLIGYRQCFEALLCILKYKWEVLSSFIFCLSTTNTEKQRFRTFMPLGIFVRTIYL